MTSFHNEETFGIKKNYHPASDFKFEVFAKVICNVSSSFGTSSL